MNEMTVNKPETAPAETQANVKVQKVSKQKSYSNFFYQLFNNLKARRYLLVVVLCVFLFFKFSTDSSYVLMLSGYVFVVIAAAVLPRPDILRPLVSVRRIQSQRNVEPIEFQALLHAMPNPAMMLNVYGILLFINREAADLFPRARKSHHLSSFIRDPDFLEAVSKSAKQDTPIEVRYHIRVPVERRLSVVVAPLKNVDRDAKNPAILVSLKDLTEIERISQMRSDFIANASHELRTPLASVLGFIDTIQGSAKDDEKAREHFLQIMRGQIERMTRLIDDLLSLSRVEMVAHLKPSDQVDINEVVDYVITALQPIAGTNCTTLRAHSELEVADVLGARDELIQLFLNLVQNSVKYGKEHGTVDIHITRTHRTSDKKGMISISVKDDGPGIGEEHLPRLTERFYRVDNELSKKKGGTGLGLAIVKHIVNRHRGELKIDSKPGIGSRFTVFIPEY